MNFLKKSYIELDNLKYSEENIAELFLILKKIIEFLKSKNPNRGTNDPLKYVSLTKEREFDNFYNKDRKDKLEDNFNSARKALMSDLRHYCTEYWNPLKDPWIDISLNSKTCS